MNGRTILIAGVFGLVFGAVHAPAGPYVLPDGELLVADFAKIPGYSSSTSAIDGKEDIAGPGARILVTLSGPDSGKP